MNGDGHPYRRVAAEATEGKPSVVTVGDASFGGGHFGVIAGPPSAAPFDEAIATARRLADAGVGLLHDGTASHMDPHARQTGDSLELARAMRDETCLPVAVGLIDPGGLDAVAEAA